MKTQRRLPGKGWCHIAGPAWEHLSGLRIHTSGVARLPDKTHMYHNWSGVYTEMIRQGLSNKRAVIVWALTLLKP